MQADPKILPSAEETPSKPSALSKKQLVLRWALSLGVCAAFIWAVEYYLGWAKVVQPWVAMEPSQFALCLAMLLATYALRTWRIYDYFKAELRGAWWRTNGLMLIHNALNNLLPARVGELSFPILMRQYFALPVVRTTSALLWFRLLDLHALLCFGLYTLVIISPLKRFLAPIMLMFFALPMLGFAMSGFFKQLAGQGAGRIAQLLHQALGGLPEYWGGFWRSWALTWLNWGAKMLSLAWLMGFFVPGASFNLRCSAVSAAELTSVLPIHSFGGFGTYESGIIAVLTKSVPISTAALGAINTHLFILGTSLVAGLLAWMMRPRKSL